MNALLGNISLTRAQKERLRKHKDTLYKLANKKTGLESRRKLFKHKGGGAGVTAFLPALLTPFLNLLSVTDDR